MSSAVLRAATGASASRPRDALGASRGPRVAWRGCVAARASSAGPSDWDLAGAPDGVVLRLAKRLERAWRELPDVADARVRTRPQVRGRHRRGRRPDDGGSHREPRVHQRRVPKDAPGGGVGPRRAGGDARGDVSLGERRRAHLRGGSRRVQRQGHAVHRGRVPDGAERGPARRGSRILGAEREPRRPETSRRRRRVLRDAMPRARRRSSRAAFPTGACPSCRRRRACASGRPRTISRNKNRRRRSRSTRSGCSTRTRRTRRRRRGARPRRMRRRRARTSASQRARLAAQTFFCEKQLENDKTRKALERSMGAERTDRYMTQVLFDVNERTPTEAVR